MKYLKDFFTNKRFKTFLWITGNSFVVLVIAYLTDLNLAWTPPIIAILNVLTKWINTKYIK
jgi:hypothetical protein